MNECKKCGSLMPAHYDKCQSCGCDELTPQKQKIIVLEEPKETASFAVGSEIKIGEVE